MLVLVSKEGDVAAYRRDGPSRTSSWPCSAAAPRDPGAPAAASRSGLFWQSSLSTSTGIRSGCARRWAAARTTAPVQIPNKGKVKLALSVRGKGLQFYYALEGGIRN